MKTDFSEHPVIVVEHDGKYWVCNVPHTITIGANGPSCAGFVNIPYINKADAEEIARKSKETTRHIFDAWNRRDCITDFTGSRRNQHLVSCS